MRERKLACWDQEEKGEITINPDTYREWAIMLYFNEFSQIINVTAL